MPTRPTEAARVIHAHVGERMRAARNMLGWTQDELAARLERGSRQDVSGYEKGETSISAGVLFQIAQALRRDVGYFYEGLSGAGVAEEAGPVASPHAARIAELLADAAPNVRRAALAVVRALVKGLAEEAPPAEPRPDPPG